MLSLASDCATPGAPPAMETITTFAPNATISSSKPNSVAPHALKTALSAGGTTSRTLLSASNAQMHSVDIVWTK